MVVDCSEPDENRRQRLADQDLHGRQRRDQQLVERALLSLARHRQRRQQQGLQHAEGGNQRREDVPAGLEIRVVPRPAFDGDRRHGAHLLVVGSHDRTEVAGGGTSGRGIAPVQNHLQRGALSQRQPRLEVRRKAEHEQHLAAVDDAGNLRGRAERGDTLEDACSCQLRQQSRGCGPATLIQDGVGRIRQVVRRAIAEQQRLQERRQENQRAGRRVLDQHQQFLATQERDPHDELQHRAHALHQPLTKAAARSRDQTPRCTAQGSSLPGRPSTNCRRRGTTS